MLDRAIGDLKFAARALRRAPVLFAAAVLTLAAGNGLATGVFAVAYGVLLRPLPDDSPDRLVLITVQGPRGGDDSGVRLVEFDEWRRKSRAFERLAAHGAGEFTIRGAGDPRVVRGAIVTEGFFDTLGAAPARGSTAVITRGARAAAFSARLAHQLDDLGDWRERGLTIGGGDFSIAAVMPPEFAFPDADLDLWVDAEAVPGVVVFGSGDQRRFSHIGRQAPGVTHAQANH